MSKFFCAFTHTLDFTLFCLPRFSLVFSFGLATLALFYLVLLALHDVVWSAAMLEVKKEAAQEHQKGMDRLAAMSTKISEKMPRSWKEPRLAEAAVEDTARS